MLSRNYGLTLFASVALLLAALALFPLLGSSSATLAGALAGE